MSELIQDGWKYEWMFEPKIVGVARSSGKGRTSRKSKVITKYRRVRRRVPNMIWVDGTG